MMIDGDAAAWCMPRGAGRGAALLLGAEPSRARTHVRRARRNATITHHERKCHRGKSLCAQHMPVDAAGKGLQANNTGARRLRPPGRSRTLHPAAASELGAWERICPKANFGKAPPPSRTYVRATHRSEEGIIMPQQSRAVPPCFGHQAACRCQCRLQARCMQRHRPLAACCTSLSAPLIAVVKCLNHQRPKQYKQAVNTRRRLCHSRRVLNHQRFKVNIVARWQYRI